MDNFDLFLEYKMIINTATWKIISYTFELMLILDNWLNKPLQFS